MLQQGEPEHQAGEREGRVLLGGHLLLRLADEALGQVVERPVVYTLGHLGVRVARARLCENIG